MDERNSGYEPIIGGWNLTDVLITGNNGTIAGQADIWWAGPLGSDGVPIRGGHWPYGRPHALLFSRCQRVVVSNITVKDSPFWSIRFWASQQLRATNLTITVRRSLYVFLFLCFSVSLYLSLSLFSNWAHGPFCEQATRHVFNNDGIDVDSSSDAVIENLYYDGGDDVIALKSGMCEAGTMSQHAYIARVLPIYVYV